MSHDHVDVLIVGAGLSGIDAACRLRDRLPGKTFTILEARGAIGGTWDLFRYPGVRSDSDMYTLGYPFRPWTGARAITDGGSIRDYIRQTARQYRVDEKIRFQHRVLAAAWSSATARWTVTARRTDTGETVTLTCSFLFACSGYYRYDQGYTPPLPGVDRFRGRLVHPQHWPDDLEIAGRRIVVIGSGATAVTLVPALADRAAHVTMLQRSPSYLLSLPATDRLAGTLRRRLPAGLGHRAVRWKNILVATAAYQFSRRAPALARSLLRRGVAARLPAGFDVDTHFAPRYAPWDQRLCLVPDGDLFRVISDGRASVVTGTIDTFTRAGIRLASGAELPAEIVVTATGLNLLAAGGMSLSVDGTPVDLSRTVAYKGMMLSGVPNFALALGYTNASWTLRCDLVSRYVCRLLSYMDRHGYRSCTPTAAPPGPLEPLIGLKSGYVLRSLDALPRQARRAPWRVYQNYPRELMLLRYGPVADRGVRFGRAPAGDREATGGRGVPDRDLDTAAGDHTAATVSFEPGP